MVLIQPTSCSTNKNFINGKLVKLLKSWVSTPVSVLMRRNMHQSKYDPSVEEIDLTKTNPQYTHVCLPNGRETMISTKQLTPAGNSPSNTFDHS